MSNQVEKLENNQVKLTFHIDAESFGKGIQEAYNKNKGKINIQGFRKGKAPRQIIEKMYGKEFFFEDAVNILLPDYYEKAVTEADLDVVSRPTIDFDGVSLENGVTVIATVFVKPEVTVSNYKGLEVENFDPEVNDEDIQARLNQELDKNARLVEITDRPVQDGDVVTLDFEGFKDGVPFEGGKGENYELTIGSKTFIDTFEEQLIGLAIGEEKEVNVNFPENYGQADLAGQPALFKTKINGIKFKELPSLDDEFAKDVSEFETLEAYKAKIKEDLTSQKADFAKNQKQNKLMETLILNTEINLPVAMIENQVESLIRDYGMQLQQQGISLDMYLEFMGQTMESLREVYKPEAEKQVRGRLILEAIANAENFEISEEDVDAEVARISAQYGMPLEQLKSVMRAEDIEGIKGDIRTQKALDIIVDTAIVK